LFEVALTGGARALGVPGGIALGAPADVISLNVEHVSARTAPGPFQRGRCATRC
jgi:cytosine/adenosine deaminase-related metal-dependent hydrolase